MSAPSTKPQVGRLESLLERVRSRARKTNASPAASPLETKTEAKADSPSQSDLAVPVAASAARRASTAPPLPTHAQFSQGSQGSQSAEVAPPSSAVPSTMELGADDMIESAAPVHAAVTAERAAPEMRPSHAPASVSESIDVEVTETEEEVEQTAPSSARRPRSERADALEAHEEPRRPQTMPPESGRQVAASASPSVPAESGKRASVPVAAFDAVAEAAQHHQIASGRAKSTNPAAFIGSPRRAPSTFGEMLDDALSF